MAFNYYVIIIGFLAGCVLFFRLPKLKKIEGNSVNDIKISVIIPARNEEDNLPNILSDLMNQSYYIHEIICVDDNSEDRTQEIIKKYGVHCVNLNTLPKGWKGKPWACQNGALAATGQVLLFLDADVRLSKSAIDSLVKRYTEQGKPLSVQPYHIVRKQHEHFSLFFNLIQICSTAMSLFGIKKKIGFYGPVLMISKALFDKHGGYEVVKNNVVEDFNLGRYYNKQGIDIDLLMGSSEIKFRMYPDSFGDVFEGWAKNFSSGSMSIQWWLLIMIFSWVAFLTAIPIELIKAIFSQDWSTLIVVVGIYFISSVSIYRIAYHSGSYPPYVCILYPIYLLSFHLIFIYSVFATFIIKSTTWKGRKL